MSTAITSEATEPSAAEALVYVPGVGQYDGSDEAALVFASRVAGALDHGSATPGAVFRVKSRVEESRQETGPNRYLVCQINRVEPSGEDKPVLDIFKLDYQNILVKNYEQQSALRRAFGTSFEALGGALRIVGALGKWKAVGRLRLIQVFVAFAMWGLMLLYFLSLLVSLVAIASTALERAQSPKTPAASSALSSSAAPVPSSSAAPAPSSSAAPAPSSSAAPAPSALVVKEDAAKAPATVLSFTGLSAWLSGLALLVAGVTSLVPEKWKAEVVRMGANYVRMSAYLSTNQDGSAVLGRFHALLEHIAEKKQPYARTHVLAYSFGSIVTLDALFPRHTHDAVRFPRLDSIVKLVTVGCPFDFVRTLWPSYFTHRVAVSKAPGAWLNVYSPADALGSNFRNDHSFGEPEVGLGERKPDNLVHERSKYGALAAFSFIALRSHAMYWKPDSDHLDQGCLREVIATMFRDEPILK